jgi:PAP2 superfamily protein
VKRRFSTSWELAIGVVAYGLYLLVGRAVRTPEGRRRARRNGERILALERRLGIAVEAALQQRLLRRPRLVHALNAGYVAFNVTITAGWLWRMFTRRDVDYHALRRACVISYVAPQPVLLLFPTEPPRRLDGFVDTIAHLARIDIESPRLVRLYNPVAAMPSMHCAFAVVTAASMADRRHPLSTVYPPFVALVVVATGNHYVLDVVAGVALGLAARRLSG